MAKKDGGRSWMIVNRAPVLTLWAAVVAEIFTEMIRDVVSYVALPIPIA